MIVEMFDFGFDPAEITVLVGTSVTWVNVGDQPQNAAARDGSFRTPFLNNGERATVTLDQPDTHPYVCTLHATRMQDMIIVEQVRPLADRRPVGHPVASLRARAGTSHVPDE